MSDTRTPTDWDIIDELKQRRRERLYAAYEEAANDLAYAAEMAALTEEFDSAITDGLEAQ